MTMHESFDVKIKKESAAMGTLYTIMDGEKLICKDEPIERAMLYLKGYIHFDHKDDFELWKYVDRHSK